MTGTPVADGPKLLPFEFRALEACLESACRCLESEVSCLLFYSPLFIIIIFFSFSFLNKQLHVELIDEKQLENTIAEQSDCEALITLLFFVCLYYDEIVCILCASV